MEFVRQEIWMIIFLFDKKMMPFLVIYLQIFVVYQILKILFLLFKATLKRNLPNTNLLLPKVTLDLVTTKIFRSIPRTKLGPLKGSWRNRYEWAWARESEEPKNAAQCPYAVSAPTRPRPSLTLNWSPLFFLISFFIFL